MQQAVKQGQMSTAQGAARTVCLGQACFSFSSCLDVQGESISRCSASVWRSEAWHLVQGATLALSMQQAVKRGQMSSAQGSARLLSFLQQKEAEQQMLSEACSSSIVGTMQAGTDHITSDLATPG